MRNRIIESVVYLHAEIAGPEVWRCYEEYDPAMQQFEMTNRDVYIATSIYSNHDSKIA